jgi:hypothetical protein
MFICLHRMDLKQSPLRQSLIRCVLTVEVKNILHTATYSVCICSEVNNCEEYSL